MEEKPGKRLGRIVQFDLDRGVPSGKEWVLADGSTAAKCASTRVWLEAAIREWVETHGVPGCTYQLVAPEGESHHYLCPNEGVAKLIVRSG